MVSDFKGSLDSIYIAVELSIRSLGNLTHIRPGFFLLMIMQIFIKYQVGDCHLAETIYVGYSYTSNFFKNRQNIVGEGRLSHATQKFVKSACVLTIIKLLR